MEGDTPQWVGYLCVAIAGVCFGSNFVPVKWYSNQVGDGLFFQWVFCSAVWCAGFIVYAARGFPHFEPLAMLGGFLWCTGNIMSVPIIKCIGLSLGMLLWGIANLLMGWCSGTFGLFGLKRETVTIPQLNYVGAGVALLSGALFALIKANTEDPKMDSKSINDQDGEDTTSSLLNSNGAAEKVFVDSINPLQKQLLGVGMAILAGALYGTNFNPPQYLIDNCATCSKVGLDYVFPHFCGIYISSTFYFIIYCVVKKNKPWVPSEVAYPAFLSGFMWALADVSWFVANSSLALVVSFPLITILPAVVASIWGILVFNEITGRKNLGIFAAGFCLTLISAGCTVISKAGV